MDGNAAENRQANLMGTLFNLNWIVGSELWIRWSDATDSRQMMGIDNVQLEAVIPQPELSLNIESVPELSFYRAHWTNHLNYLVEESTDLSNWINLATNPGVPGEKVSVMSKGWNPSTPTFMRLTLN